MCDARSQPVFPLLQYCYRINAGRLSNRRDAVGLGPRLHSPTGWWPRRGNTRSGLARWTTLDSWRHSCRNRRNSSRRHSRNSGGGNWRSGHGWLCTCHRRSSSRRGDGRGGRTATAWGWTTRSRCWRLLQLLSWCRSIDGTTRAHGWPVHRMLPLHRHHYLRRKWLMPS